MRGLRIATIRLFDTDADAGVSPAMAPLAGHLAVLSRGSSIRSTLEPHLDDERGHHAQIQILQDLASS
jgi:hypothetical protein